MSKKMLMRSFGAVVNEAFVMNVQTDNAGASSSNQFSIPTNGSGYNYDVSTSDGQVFLAQTGSLTITFPSDGNYDISITGDFPTIYFNNGGDRLKLLDIKNWGIISWTNFFVSFRGCSNLTTLTATDAPDLSSCSNLGIMFQDCTNFNANLNNWDVSGVTSFRNIFKSCAAFNQDISSWDMSGATNMEEMFNGASSFNQDISSWDTSGASTMKTMFNGASSFNQDISSWDINQVSNLLNFMSGVTLSTSNYDALLIAWDAQGAMSYSGTVNFGNSKYTSGGAAETARTSLIAKWGGISDGGAA